MKINSMLAVGVSLNSMLTHVEVPLVSIVISNYNYARYLTHTIRSCLAQNYPAIEIIFVDDVSTDESILVAEQELAHALNSHIVKRLVNGGQGAALRDGFEASSGEYIVFLDSDDILFDNFVGTHVYTHLTLPWQVAFTSSQLAHIGPTGRLITGTSGGVRHTLLGAPKESDVQLPALKIATHIDSVLNEFAKNISRCIYLPPDRVGYHWSSCSGLLFKRAAIKQILFEEVLRTVRLSADFYFTLSHLFNGSAVIDPTLGCYRIHDDNAYSGEIGLDRIDPYRGDSRQIFCTILSSFIGSVTGPRLEQCARRLSPEWFFPLFLAALQEYAGYFIRPGTDSRIVANQILQRLDQVFRVLGRENTLKILVSLGVTEEEIVQNTELV